MRFLVNSLLFALLASCDDAAWPKLATGPEVLRGAKPKIERIASGPTWIWLKESYPSKPEGMSRCQAGQEVFLRLLEKKLGEKRYRETLHRKISSCHQDIELAEDGLAFNAASQTLTLKILGSPPIIWSLDSTRQSWTSK